MSQIEILKRLHELHDHGLCACQHAFGQHKRHGACKEVGCTCQFYRGRWKQVARLLEINPCHLSEILSGRRQAGPKVLKALFPDRKIEKLYVTHSQALAASTVKK